MKTLFVCEHKATCVYVCVYKHTYSRQGKEKTSIFVFKCESNPFWNGSELHGYLEFFSSCQEKNEWNMLHMEVLKVIFFFIFNIIFNI